MATVHRNNNNHAPPLSIPPTQNTAPVLEFNCMYSHDVRRKQKRWQDGFLRYHTFNRRVMVYDVPRNFIGDMHWQGEDVLQEGDELKLEKGGMLVQVVDLVGHTETDLTELRKSKNNNRPVVPELRSSSPPVAEVSAPLSVSVRNLTARRNVPRPPAHHQQQLQHKSLNALLGTPKAPIGKANIPVKSPFEERHSGVENEEWESGGRPSKRPRLGNETRNAVASKAAKQATSRLNEHTTAPSESRKQKAAASVPKQPQTDVTNAFEPLEDFFPLSSGDSLLVSSPNADRTAPPVRPSVSRSSSPSTRTRPEARPVSGVESCQMLRLTTKASKKKTLLCKDQLIERSKRTFSTRNTASESLPRITDDEGPSRQTRALLQKHPNLTSPKDGNPSKLRKKTSNRAIDNVRDQSALVDLISDDELEVSPATPFRATRAPPAIIPDNSDRAVMPPAPLTKQNSDHTTLLQTGDHPHRGSEAVPNKWNPTTTKHTLPTSRISSEDQIAPVLSDISTNVDDQQELPPANAEKFSTEILRTSVKDLDPWSREAFDLFTWRPPGWK